MMNYQMPSIDSSCILSAKRRLVFIEHVWNVFNHRNRNLDVFFHAVHLCEETLTNFFDPSSHNYDEKSASNAEEELAVMVVGAVEVASKVDCQRGVAHHFTDIYSMEAMRKWELRHLLSCNFALSRHHVLHFLRLIHPISFQVVPAERSRHFWNLCQGIAVLAMFSSKAINCLPSRLAAAVLRVAFAMEEVTLTREQLLCLQHPEEEYANVCINIIETIQKLQEKGKSEVFAYFNESGVYIAAINFSLILENFKNVARQQMGSSSDGF